MNATELWVSKFIEQMNCVGCLEYGKEKNLFYHSGDPVDVSNTPIEDLENKLDRIDVWCNDCKIFRSTRARARGRMKSKEEAAVMAGLRKAEWHDLPSHQFVLHKNLVTTKQDFYHEAKNAPCAHCQQTYHYASMEFFHLLPKGGTVGVMVRDNTGLPALVREMERCALLCANCSKFISHTNWHGCLPLWRYEDHKERIITKMEELSNTV